MAERADVLAGLAAASPPGDVILAALPGSSRLNLRAVTADIPTLAVLFGIGFSTIACRSVTDGDRATLWLGPDEWLLIAPDPPAPEHLAAAEALAGVTDVSHRSTTIEISGPGGATVLNAFCALDLAEAAFPVGMCTRTLLGKAEIVLWRTAADRFRIDVARSFARHVWGCLEEGRREFVPA